MSKPRESSNSDLSIKCRYSKYLLLSIKTEAMKVYYSTIRQNRVCTIPTYSVIKMILCLWYVGSRRREARRARGARTASGPPAPAPPARSTARDTLPLTWRFVLYLSPFALCSYRSQQYRSITRPRQLGLPGAYDSKAKKKNPSF